MTFHPPSILSGYIWFTVPFAFAVAAMIHKRLNDSWIRTTRRYAVVSWGFLSIGNLFGGMWGLSRTRPGWVLGLGPGRECVAYALVHGDGLPAFSDDSGTPRHVEGLEHRTGVSHVLPHGLWHFPDALWTHHSVHTFAQSDIGDYFVVALSVLAAFCIILLVVRVADGSLKSKADIDSIASREGVFLLNNLLLLGCMGVVMFGTLGSKISAYFWQETTYTPSWFNAWMVPGGLALIVLMGIGPLIPWRKVTLKSLRKNFLVPTVVSLVATGLIYAVDAYHLQEHVAATHVPFGEVPLGRIPLVAELTGIYALIGFFGVFFVTYTLLVEFHRGARIRGKMRRNPMARRSLGCW